VSSFVHRDNRDMIDLNKKLGAVVIPDTDPTNLDHCICTIEIQSTKRLATFSMIQTRNPGTDRRADPRRLP
jgi:hypothetical protein